MLRNAKGHHHHHHHDLANKSGNNNNSSVLEIKEGDKFFSRLLSKESSISNTSLRFGASSVAVPFVWESQPGTPKHPLFFEQSSVPPLTPPPSYHLNGGGGSSKAKSQRSIKMRGSRRSTNIFMAFIPKLNLKRIILSPPPPTPPSSSSSPPSFSSKSLSSSSSSSSSWWRSTPNSSSSRSVVPVAARIERRRRFLSYGSSSFDFRGDDDGGVSPNNPSPLLCFGIPRAASSNSGFQSSFRRHA